tara:strand:- start:42 stop:2087 length:2046 start_codon:yes stop_codon:yes gene_type:complete
LSKNEIKLQEGFPVDENLRPVEVGGELTGLELSKDKVKARNLNVSSLKSDDNITTSSLYVAGSADIADTLTMYSKKILFKDSTCDYNNDPTIAHDANPNIVAGLTVSGTGIPDGAYISSITNETQFELSAATTGGSVTNGTLTFGTNLFKIETLAEGATKIETVDSDGESGDLTIQADGHMNINAPFYNKAITMNAGYLLLSVVTKTVSYPTDKSFSISETLDLSSGAGGSDQHRGLNYKQTQTNLGGWDAVYLMYLYGLRSGEDAIFSVDKDALLLISNPATVKTITDFITLTNSGNAADMDGTGTAIKFNQWYYDGSSPATEDSARIVVATESDWTSTASSRDSYMNFFISQNGSLIEKLKIRAGITSISIEDGSDNSFQLTNGGNVSHGFYAESGAESRFEIYEAGGDSNNDFFRISTGVGGATTLSTTDASANAANLTLDPDGDINLNAFADVNIPANIGLTFGDAGEKIEGDGTDLTITSSRHLALKATTGSMYLDSGTGIFNFRPNADTDDQFQITVTENTGATKLETVSDAADGHLSVVADGHVEFDGCGVGFDLETPTYNATDTDVDFRTGNKQFVTFGSGNIADLNLKFPATSGNFTLLLKQDGTGSRTVASDGWLAFDSDGNAANGSASVKFPGGTNPTLTTDANHVDIISFFWDADNEIAYGVASLDFQF